MIGELLRNNESGWIDRVLREELDMAIRGLGEQARRDVENVFSFVEICRVREGEPTGKPNGVTDRERNDA
jgi:hypothetical protein